MVVDAVEAAEKCITAHTTPAMIAPTTTTAPTVTPAMPPGLSAELCAGPVPVLELVLVEDEGAADVTGLPEGEGDCVADEVAEGDVWIGVEGAGDADRRGAVLGGGVVGGSRSVAEIVVCNRTKLVAETSALKLRVNGPAWVPLPAQRSVAVKLHA